MLEWTIDGTTLKNHFERDHFFDNSDTLHIIDDHNILDINDEAVCFYQRSFDGLGLRTINIYYQIKGVNENRRDEIVRYANRNGINPNLLLSFLVFSLNDFYPNKLTLEDIFRKKHIQITRAVRQALYFMDKMNEINISVNLCPFQPLGFEPPFHGRYWFTDEKGYIVDASLNTFDRGMIFAQLMDLENFDIIKRQLFENHVIPNSIPFGHLNRQIIDDMCNCLHLR